MSPKEDFYRGSREVARERKTAQLCAQVERALQWALESELEDPILTELAILDVQPYPSSSHLLVLVAVPRFEDIAEAQDSLRRASGILREYVAQSVTRRRVPFLSFGVIPASSQ